MTDSIASERGIRSFFRRALSRRGRISTPKPGGVNRHRRVAAIVDEFTRASFAPDVTLLSLDRRTWVAEMIAFDPELLFVESAWRGQADSWKGRVASYPSGARHRTLAAVLRYCRWRKIPTVFWNKEDPVHYDRFIAAAAQFDGVFTTAVEKNADYQRDCDLPSPRVGTLPFAVQPEIYSRPKRDSEPNGRENLVVFAGSYGESHFPERRRQLELLLDGAALACTDSGAELSVFDRNHTAGNPDKLFPDRFAGFIRGGCPYTELASHYGRARVGLNVNSVTESSTMYSRRVVEMLACGLPVVSTESVGLAEIFDGAVTIVRTVEQAHRAVAELLDDEEKWRAQAMRGRSLVADGHTTDARISQVLAMADAIRVTNRRV